MNDTQAIQEQLADAAEATNHLTKREQIQFEREMNAWFDAVAEDHYFEYMMDKRFKA